MKRLICLIAIVLPLLAFVAGCMKPPQAPSWETVLNVPLLNKMYTASELADSTDFVIENDSLFFLQNGELESVEVSDELNISAHEENFYWLPLPPNGTAPGALVIDESGFAEDDIAVAHAVIEDWAIEFEFRNVDTALQQVTVLFDDIYDNNQQNLQVTITSFDTPTVVDLSAVDNTYYSIGLPGSTALYDSLAFNVTVTSTAGAPIPVADMRTYFHEQIQFREMWGMVYRKSLTVDDSDIDIDIDYPDGAGDAVVIAYGAARIELNVWNQLGYTVELRGRLTATNDDGESRSITFDEADNLVFAPASAIYDSTLTTKVIRDSVSWMLNIFPSRIVLENARFIVGRDQGEYGFAYTGAEARGDIEGRLPFLFRLTGEPMDIPEPQTTEISTDNQEYIEDYALSGAVVFEVENNFPAAAAVEIFLSTTEDEDSLYTEPILYFPREGENNYIPALGVDSLRYELSVDDIFFFTNSTISVGMRFTFDETQEDVYIAPQDFLGLRGRTRIQLLIDND